ncbi:acetyl-CoA synthetase-like protein [Schizopora paradoxa]|uniref:Acetyl-CoA synthetase-like protein n=1 Tax=Schizopora paradoxa TaxID=27342 RepID=A0A0H2RXW0_9AGAM|nr:acetyl-CoA synthetase-like protein [Schizopora paradoxa]
MSGSSASTSNYKVLPLPEPPKTQSLSSSTFKTPPLDGSLTLPEIYDWHLEQTPSHPLFVYSDGDGKEHTILWPEGVRAVHRAGGIVRSLLSPSDAVDVPRTSSVVAILAGSDTITYFTFIMGIVRAGHTAFPISTRNSPAAIAHLLKKTGTSHLLVGREPVFQSLATKTLELLQSTKPRLSQMPAFEDIYACSIETSFTPLPLRRPNMEEPAIILQSSGSTSTPKPIVWTHYFLLQLSRTPFFGERDMTGVRLSCHSLPMFHGMGVVQTGWTAMAGIVISTFQPKSPAIQPNAESVIKGCIETRSDMIFCFPSFVEEWSRQPNNVNYLKKIGGILYGGGPLNKIVGDELYRKGVSIFMLYACTECGPFSMFLPKTANEDFEYFRLPKNVKPKFIADDNGNAEFIVMPHGYMRPCVFNTRVDGTDAYATGDLLTPHPTKAGYWKVFGRADDQIIFSTGEKANPSPLENMLTQDSRIQSAVIFGRGRPRTGAIIEPKPGSGIDSHNFLELTWPTIERMNEVAPRHARILREMVLLAKPSKPFLYTAKNTTRRQAIIDEYEEEIDALYHQTQ